MHDEQEWQPCPQGLLDEVALAQKASRVRRISPLISSAIAIAACILILAYTAQFLQSSSSGENLGGITCTTAIAHMKAYHSQQLSVQDAQAVDDHLAACPSCRKTYKSSLDKMTHYIRNAYRVAFAFPGR
ncbi:MAG: hypothetical protein ACI9G1_003410 [Pirellulaceae bacterium]|jgi:hypothetical protein